MLKNLIGIYFCLILNISFAFEIKPISAWGGAEDDEISKAEYKISNDGYGCRNTKDYMIFYDKNQALHEALTRQAYQDYHKKPLQGRNWENPLIAGVEWNDDPEQLIRKTFFAGGYIPIPWVAWTQLNEFDELLESKRPENSITVRSHYGDLQFLHAMRPVINGQSLDSKQTSAKIMNWLEHIYPIVINLVNWNESLSRYDDGWFLQFHLFTEPDKKIIDIFDRKNMWRNSDLDRQKILRHLVAGTILHMIQDAYSQSHTKRENGKLICMNTYDEENRKLHCISDTAIPDNQKSLENARKKSAEFIEHWDKRHTWTQVKPFFEEIFLPEYASQCESVNP